VEARYFRVRKWEDFQHYKQRNPPWIRLHRTLLRDHKFNKLTETEQWMLVRVWLLASETANHMAYDERWVRRAINSSRKVPLEKFVSMGFLEETCELLASSLLAGRGQHAEPEAEGSDSSDDSEQNRSTDSAQGEIEERVDRLLKVCRDSDDGTAAVLRSYLHGARENDVAFAIESARGPGVLSPTKVAVAYLRKQSEAREAA
jgi:hypothetical protein